MRCPSRPLACLLGIALTGCGDYPRDAEASLQRARDDAIRVGLSHDPPFVDLGHGAPAGIEVDWIARFAAARGMRVEWVPGAHERLMHDLVGFRLHVVAGGHSADSPWRDVSWSRPVRIRTADGLVERRFALPPGENAWQLAVDRQLHADAPRLSAGADR